MKKVAMQNDPAVLEWIKKLGIELELVQRVIIDLQVNEPVRIYVTRLADAGAFDIDPPDAWAADVVEYGQAAE